MILSSSEFTQLKDLIYSKCGIYLNEKRRDFLSRRADNRMRDLQLLTCKDYLRFLKFDTTGRELNELIDAVVTRETYFFRDYKQLKMFAEQVLPAVVEKADASAGLSVLSAGCSSGEEPYTLAIIMAEMLADDDTQLICIEGADICDKNLAKAAQAVYGSYALRQCPHLYRDRYFSSRNGDFILVPQIKSMVNIAKANLYNETDMARYRGFDIVFCRNVLIYFDHNSAGRVLENLYHALKPGGYLILGHAEAAGKSTELFKMVRLEGGFAYQK